MTALSSGSVNLKLQEETIRGRAARRHRTLALNCGIHYTS